MSDAMYMKTLQPGYRRKIRDKARRRAAAVEALIRSVRIHLPRMGSRTMHPAKATVRMDFIRDALAALDRIEQENIP